MYTIAYHTVFDEMAAEDITHDVFLKLYKHFQSFRGESKLSTWVFRITKNACYNYLKKEKRFLKTEEINENSDVKNEINLEKEWEDYYGKMELHNILNKLPFHYRMALNLYYFNEHSYEETANIMGIPLNTLKSYIHRAKKELTKRIKSK